MPFAPSEFSDRANVAIPLLEPGRGLRAELGITSRWDQDPYCPSLASLIDSFVNGPGVIRAVGGYGRNGVIKLLKQVRDRSAVMRSASGQIRRDDLTCISINRLPPSGLGSNRRSGPAWPRGHHRERTLSRSPGRPRSTTRISLSGSRRGS